MLRTLLSAVSVRRLAVSTLLAAAACAQTPLPYRDPKLTMEQRVDDLVSRMTLEEKVSQLRNDSVAIPRLGVPSYNWWNEALHGVARAGRATVFPQPIGLAATFDRDLIFRMATVIGDEARAKYNEAQRRGEHGIFQGLTLWSPNINLFRDPRWGRGMETFGEDPYLTGRLAIEFTRGLQGNDAKYFKAVATPKHLAVHSGPESMRHTFNAVISERDLWQSYLPHFEAVVREGGAYSVMCAYNRLDGVPACANTRLIEEILRKSWGFGGVMVSDCGAVDDIYSTHKTWPTAEQGVAASLKAGTDLTCGPEFSHLLGSVKQGLVTEKDIDTALRRVLMTRFRLGEFDPPAMVPFSRIGLDQNDSPAHAAVALEAARKSIVLLKNDNATLPLSKSLKTLAVIGPNADEADVMLGNYNGEPSAPVTPLAGLRAKLGNARVVYARGTDLAPGLPHFDPIPSSALRVDATDKAAHGLKAEYFDLCDFDGVSRRSRSFAQREGGKPADANAKPVFTQVEPEVSYHWWDKAPRTGLDANDFGIRWTGYLVAPVTGTYALGAIGQTAWELYLDGKKIVTENNLYEAAYRSANVQLEAGKRYAVRLDYHHFANSARIQLVWALPSKIDVAAQAVDTAKQADAVVLVLGLSPRLEGEEMNVPVEGFKGGDRIEIGLPKVQEELMQKIVALGKPTVLVLMNGSALAVNWAREHVPAIVDLWYPGQAGGTALADVLFGDYNPAGRLPVTFYKAASDLPAFDNYAMRGRTYRYFTGEPLYPFGYGLSYTRFAYSKLDVPASAKAGEPLTFTVEVANVGARAGDEVVQVYASANDEKDAPVRTLVAMERVTLNAGERKQLRFTLKAEQLALYNNAGQLMAQPGAWTVSAGGKQPGFTGVLDASTTGVVSATVKLTGEARALRTN